MIGELARILISNLNSPNEKGDSPAREESLNEAPDNKASGEKQDLEEVREATRVSLAEPERRASADFGGLLDDNGEDFTRRKRSTNGNGAHYREQFLTHLGKNVGLISNGISTLLHGSAILTQLVPFFNKKKTKLINDFATEFSRLVVPLNYVVSGIKALLGKRILEAGIRFSLPSMLLSVPFYNFTIPYGIHSGFNFFHEAVMDNLEKKNGSPKFKSFTDNIVQVLGESKNIFSKLFSSETIDELLNFTLAKQKQQAIACVLMSASAIAAMFTSRKERATPKAKLWGSIRNLNGGWGDLLLALGRPQAKDGKEFLTSFKDLKEAFGHKKMRSNFLSGSFMGLASVLGIFHRLFVKSDALANIIVHAQMLADNIGFTIWGLLSEERTNDAKKAEKS